MDLKDKIVVITGAGSGMGRAYAKVYAEAGARLALNDFNPITLAETVEQYGRKDTVSSAFDVGDRAAMFAFAEQILESFGRVDIVINNAGVMGGFKPIWELTAAEFERTLYINLGGVINSTQAFLPSMLQAQSGQIVNVSSIFGLIGAPNNGDYSASKFAVRGFTEALMTELQETGVTAHLVHPGGIATNICKINGEEQEFSKHFLKTTADNIAYHVRAKLLMGSPKIVYGKDSLKTWFASNFIPLKWLSKLVWNEIKPVLDSTPYSKVRRS